MIFHTSNQIFKIKQPILQKSTKFLKKPQIGYARNSAKSFTASPFINKSESGNFYRNLSRITAYKMIFPNFYNMHTIAPKRRTKTMLIGLSKIAQNSPESPQKLNNLTQKYNHIQIHIFSSILTFKSLIYSSNPN